MALRRLGGMPKRTAGLVATIALATMLLSGCGLMSFMSGLSGGAGSTAPFPGSSQPGQSVPVAPGGTPGVGGSSPGGTPGTVGSSPGDVLPPGGIPDAPTIVVVHPGQANLRVVQPVQLTAVVSASHQVVVRVRWWGGIEPCEVLDSVAVDRDGSTFTITARVGSTPGGQVACIDIARDTATLVDLGVLPSGRYTVRASAGDAAPVEVVVP